MTLKSAGMLTTQLIDPHCTTLMKMNRRGRLHQESRMAYGIINHVSKAVSTDFGCFQEALVTAFFAVLRFRPGHHLDRSPASAVGRLPLNIKDKPHLPFAGVRPLCRYS